MGEVGDTFPEVACRVCLVSRRSLTQRWGSPVHVRASRRSGRDPRNGWLRMSEPRGLVEHFFRHEFGRLCAVLTRSLGVRRLDLVEDVVQSALVQALETWSRRGAPEDPAGWLYRTARNLAIDALRRERTPRPQALPRPGRGRRAGIVAVAPRSAFRRRDRRRTASLALRLLPRSRAGRIPRRPRVADASVGGFSTGVEIARAVAHHFDANVQKRMCTGAGIGCAASWTWNLDTPAARPSCSTTRLDAVLAVVYLLFKIRAATPPMATCRSAAAMCDEARRPGADARRPGSVGDVPMPLHAPTRCDVLPRGPLRRPRRSRRAQSFCLRNRIARAGTGMTCAARAWRGASPGSDRQAAIELDRRFIMWKPASPGSTARPEARQLRGHRLAPDRRMVRYA